jgi:hypothetical protein
VIKFHLYYQPGEGFAVVSYDIASDIARVRQALNGITSDADKVRNNADDMRNLSKLLNSFVRTFKVLIFDFFYCRISTKSAYTTSYY